MGGIWLTKSPNGTAITPFLPDLPALRTDPVGDDAGEDEDHPDHDHEMGEVLLERERPDQLVVDGVEDACGRAGRGGARRTMTTAPALARRGTGRPPVIAARGADLGVGRFCMDASCCWFL